MTAEAKNRVIPDVLYLGVVPVYRQACVDILLSRLSNSLRIFAGSSHLDRSVTTGIRQEQYSATRVLRMGNFAFVQFGYLVNALRAPSVIVDLNPRSVTAWFLLLGRLLLRSRTLVWGHLHPRAGTNAPTRGLRLAMRRLASGTVLYGYDGVNAAQEDLQSQPVWVAPNSLYPADQMVPAEPSGVSCRVVYVGRVVQQKKVDLIVRALAEIPLQERNVMLDLVGVGDDLDRVLTLARELGVETRIKLHGTITDPSELRGIYADAICSVSPGYAGLSLTQSLGFGVPAVVAEDEPHAPEIELKRLGGVRFFRANDEVSLAATIASEMDRQREQNRAQLSALTRGAYSAEAMADGIIRALRGERQILNAEGWPTVEVAK